MKLLKILILLVGITFISIGIFTYYNSPPSLMQEETISIKTGDTIKSVSRKLKQYNLIKSEQFLIIVAKVSGKTLIRTGKYRIFRDLTTIDILKKIHRGDVLRKKVTIPEGFNLYQIAERLDALYITDKEDFLKYTFDSEYLKKLKINAPSAEGYLFPDTYSFPEESDAREIILSMHRQLKRVIKSIGIRKQKKGKLSTHQILIIASMVEKEARVAGERRYISSVFHNRNNKGMKFDCDPTVRYARKKFTGKLNYFDLEFKSPYNTYVTRGFPPTPICSSGVESIKAALSPVKSSYLYFVSRNDGSHYFSKNLKEHNRAVAFYQKGIKNGFIDKQQL